MTRQLLLLLLVTSCASLPTVSSDAATGDPSGATQSPAQPVEGDATLGAAAAVPASLRRVSPPPAEEKTHLAPYELSLWNDPRFKKSLVESYMAETEVEPEVTLAEREDLIEILDLIASDEVDDALELVLDNTGEVSSAVFDFTLGNIRLQRDEMEAAAAAYEKAVDKYPKFLRAHRNLGRIRTQQARFEAAAQALTRVLELGGGDALTYGLLGFSYLNTANYLSAESAFRYATLLDPATLDWKMGLAESLFRQERFQDTASLCSTLIAEDPEFQTAWMLQANAYLGLGQPARAAENYELLERLGGSTVDSLSLLGDIYVNEGLFDLAANAYARAVQKDTSDRPERSLRAAQVLLSRTAYDETRGLLDTIEDAYALGVDDQKEVLKLRSRIALAAGAGDEEARILEEVVELDPLDGDALILLGQHARRSGDEARAAFLFERAASLDDHEADAKKNHGQLLVAQGKYREAVPLLRRAQDLTPSEGLQKYLEQVERLAQGR